MMPLPPHAEDSSRTIQSSVPRCDGSGLTKRSARHYYETWQTSSEFESFIRECVSKVSVLPITPEIAARAASFPECYPKDPLDRLIGATALVEGAGLVTHDRGIAKSGLVPVIR
jgi:predicted nucleic acid-binding protein